MSRESVRQYLRMYLNETQKAKEIAKQIEYLSTEAYDLRSGYPTADKVQSSPRTYDKIGEIIGKIDAETDKLTAQYQEALDKKSEVVQVIFSVKNPAARSVLLNRYIDGFAWDHVCAVQGCSLRWAHDLEEKGLAEIEENIPQTAH